MNVECSCPTSSTRRVAIVSQKPNINSKTGLNMTEDLFKEAAFGIIQHITLQAVDIRFWIDQSVLDEWVAPMWFWQVFGTVLFRVATK